MRAERSTTWVPSPIDRATIRAREPALQQALAIARETGDRRMEGVALGNLGAVSERQGDLPAARTYYEQCRPPSLERSATGQVRAYSSAISAVSALLGDLAAARCFFEQALLLAREIGRQQRESLVLNIPGDILRSGDYAAAGKCCGQSLQLRAELGNRRRGRRLQLGSSAYVCGHTASILRQASLQIARSMGDRPQEIKVLADLGLLCHHLGQDQAAREHCRRALGIAHGLGDRQIEASAVTHLGHALAELGQLAEAGDAYRQSLALRRTLGQPHLATEPLAGLARVCPIQENPIEAQALVDGILGHLESHTLEGTEEPVRVYLTCYRVLTANQDLRAGELLDTAHRLLQERAAKIGDEEMRRSYLENVPAHREIVQEFAKTA